MAVYVTDVLAHAGFEEAAIATLTGNNGFTVRVIVFEVAGFPVGQTAFDAITHRMASPFVGE